MDINMTVTQENTKFFPMHKHDKVEFMCYIKGTGHLRTDVGNFAFKEGTVVVIPSGIRHGSEADDDFVNICVHADINIPDIGLHYIYDGTSQQRKLFELLRELYFSGNYENAISLLTMALRELIYHPTNGSAGSVDVNAQVREIYEKIIKNFQNCDFDLTKTIESTGYNEDYFRERFKECYGITPKYHLYQLRMDYAAGLIMTYGNTLEIGRIASLCGYDDALYFSKKFKKFFGCSPSRYVTGNITNPATGTAGLNNKKAKRRNHYEETT